MKTVLYPAILPVPAAYQSLPLKEKSSYLSRYARHGLQLSARHTGIEFNPDALLKNEHGAPLPVNGYYWSVTHKPEYVGAVFSPAPIGIDIEKQRHISAAMFERTADKSEWRLGKEDNETLFFRYWTAKEAVLKAAGVGIAGLAQCRISQLCDAHHLLIDYAHERWWIEHVYFDGHIASIVKNNCLIRWQISCQKTDPLLP
jgi:4'-phosphopantetheinyl transferase